MTRSTMCTGIFKKECTESHNVHKGNDLLPLSVHLTFPEGSQTFANDLGKNLNICPSPRTEENGRVSRSLENSTSWLEGMESCDRGERA